MARLVSKHGDGILDEMDESDRQRMKTNFTNSLAKLALNFEEMILKHAVSLADTVGRAAVSILAVLARLRPARSFPRRSRKPVGKWSRRQYRET
ncbi:MAG: hypothetical protein OXC26_06210 [Albidovulum sp.]|nr:hypothetical protein [Albidovulum sp.]